MANEDNSRYSVNREKIEKRIPGIMLTIAEAVLLSLVMIVGGHAMMLIFNDGFGQIDFQWVAQIVLVFLV